MFAQFFLVILGVLGLVLGLKTDNYLWAFSGLVMLISSGLTLYQLKTGKRIFERSR